MGEKEVLKRRIMDYLRDSVVPPSKSIILSKYSKRYLIPTSEIELYLQELEKDGVISIKKDSLLGEEVNLTDKGIQELKAIIKKEYKPVGTVEAISKETFATSSIEAMRSEISELRYYLEKYQYGRKARENQYKGTIIVIAISSIISVIASALIEWTNNPSFSDTFLNITVVGLVAIVVLYVYLRRSYGIQLNTVKLKSANASLREGYHGIRDTVEGVAGRQQVTCLVDTSTESKVGVYFIKKENKVGKLTVDFKESEILIATETSELGKKLAKELKEKLEADKSLALKPIEVNVGE